MRMNVRKGIGKIKFLKIYQFKSSIFPLIALKGYLPELENKGDHEECWGWWHFFSIKIKVSGIKKRNWNLVQFKHSPCLSLLSCYYYFSPSFSITSHIYTYNWNIGLAKKSVWVFPLHLTEKPKWTFWPSQ